jgi:flagellin
MDAHFKIFIEENTMALSINTNVASLNAQRNLGASQTNLNKSMQRLSSGLRINSAKDDAAGLAISDRMTSQIRGLNQAVRNANDGISLAQTAEGALSETTNILQRMRELAVQSANDTNTASDRSSLQDEVDQLIAEMDRIASTTAFNGKNVIDGTLNDATFQVGANAGQTIKFSIGAAGAGDIGQIAQETGSTAVVGSTASNGSNFQINDIDIVAAKAGTNGRSNTSAYALAQAINSSSTGVRAEAVATTTGDIDAATLSTPDMVLTLNGVSIFDGSGSPTTVADTISQINVYSGETGVIATTGSTSTDIVLTAEDGRDIVISDAAGTDDPFVDGTTTGSLKLTSADNFTLNAALATESAISSTVTKDTNTISAVKVDTVPNSSDAIDRIDAAISTVDDIRGGLGAIQNRFESTIANLQNVSENLSAARSRILDADIAQETSAMTKNNILQQAGVSILAQANQAPQLALSLLG